ncbi:GPALPP motifs-containing protein 1 [Choanephora cucurbitarum]|uniref:GPALPP motifs-containing protein 1 n=1 Tax=Choanephora cucurbitarum TaxID=101091 RepID=A0A1C7N9D1_9FUNG|nr:GPALPP motifs-containing protein 1 [Choanephora cucurbitarum]
MIGPAIPEELLKNKRQNQAEIDIALSDDESDTLGPQLPPQDVTVGPAIPADILVQRRQREEGSAIGPQIPDHIKQQKINSDEIAISDDDAEEVVTGPAMPPHILEKMNKNAQPEEEEVDAADFAPALPPDLLAERHQQQTESHGRRRRRPAGPSFPMGSMPSVEDDDDLVGPSLPQNYNPEEESKYSAIQAIEERARQSRESMENKDKKDTKIERPEWMLAPPEVDYLKAAHSGKSRQFSNRNMTEEERDNTAWIETPADRERRLHEEQKSGGKRKAYDQQPTISKEEMQVRQNVHEYNIQTRPMTLLEMHQQGRKKRSKQVTDEEDVSKRPFDREKDLLSGGRKLDRKQKKEIFKNSSELGSKFGYGRSSFL